MKPSKIIAELKTSIAAGIPTMIWGAPGVGKSAVVRAVSESVGMLVDLRASQLDPVDARGIPSVRDGKTYWNPPAFFPTEGKGILFLDELNTAPPAVQAALYQLILDRRLGEYELPEGWEIVAAGNRETDRAVTHRMSSALGSRLRHLNFEVDMDDWSSWALDHGIQPLVLAFVRFRPLLLHNFEPGNRTFPCPRTWEYLSRYLAAGGQGDECESVAGIVGEGAAAEFAGFCKIAAEIPNPDTCLLTPDTAPVPTSPATRYALTTALAARVTAPAMSRFCTYLARLPAEFSVLAMADAIRRDRALSQTPEYTRWTIKNKDILL